MDTARSYLQIMSSMRSVTSDTDSPLHQIAQGQRPGITSVDELPGLLAQASKNNFKEMFVDAYEAVCPDRTWNRVTIDAPAAIRARPGISNWQKLVVYDFALGNGLMDDMVEFGVRTISIPKDSAEWMVNGAAAVLTKGMLTLSHAFDKP